jgi:hypothetical protein
MGNYVARGTVYHEYTVEIEAESADEARQIAESMGLDEWSDDGVSGMDIYEVYEEGEDDE